MDAARRGGLKLDFPLLLALSDGLVFFDLTNGTRGAPQVGVPFFESAVIPRKNLEVAKTFDLIVAGSSWNAEVMARHGVANVRTCLQGVDLSLFKPRSKTARFAGRFVVFSGGKLEYRKGQDLVVAAFKKFHARHPDALGPRAGAAEPASACRDHRSDRLCRPWPALSDVGARAA